MFNLKPRENAEFEEEYDDIVPKEGVQSYLYFYLFYKRKYDIQGTEIENANIIILVLVTVERICSRKAVVQQIKIPLSKRLKKQDPSSPNH